MALKFTLDTVGPSTAKSIVEDTKIIHTKRGKIPASAVVVGDFMCLRDDVTVKITAIETV